ERTEQPAPAAPGKPPEAKGNSSITFWGSNSAATAYEKPVSPPAKPKNNSFSWRDLFGLVFYVFLLVAAFGIGRYYEEVVSWMTGEPKQAVNRANFGGRSSDPEVAAARALFDERRYGEARERLAQLLTKQPNNAELRYWLGRTSYELKQYAEAAK